MPKIFGKEVNPLVLYGAVAICGVLVYNAAFPAEESAAAPTRTKKKTTAKKDNSIYLPEDYEAKFASFQEPVKNAFRPLIAKKAATVAPPTGPASLAGGLPITLTGGEGNWAYTGYAEVDGVRQGLLENSATGESVFLVAGQRWKQLVVRSVTAENMTVAGPDGVPIPIPVKDPTAEQRRPRTFCLLRAPLRSIRVALSEARSVARPLRFPARRESRRIRFRSNRTIRCRTTATRGEGAAGIDGKDRNSSGE